MNPRPTPRRRDKSAQPGAINLRNPAR